jgi:hypothetical protein
MFKIGYYYKFIGKPVIWWKKNKKKILDNKWHKCVEIKKEPFYYNYNYAKFEGMEKEQFWGYEDFIESKHHPYVKKLLEEINGSKKK